MLLEGRLNLGKCPAEVSQLEPQSCPAIVDDPWALYVESSGKVAQMPETLIQTITQDGVGAESPSLF